MRAQPLDAWWNTYTRKPALSLIDPTVTRNCQSCGSEFRTQCRHKVRCDSCQSRFAATRQKLANEKMRAKRRMRRAGGIGL